MARFNEILVGRYNRMLQKLMSMKGGPPAPQLSSEIVPAFTFFNGAENRFLEAWQRYAVVAVSGLPAAGNRAAVRIRMPAGSNVIAVLEKLQIWEVTGADNTNIFYNSIATVMPTENNASIPANQIQGRGGQTGSTAIISTSINFGLLGSNPIWNGNIAANALFDYINTDIVELPLEPNSEYTIVSNALVQQIAVNFLWRERFLEDSERS